VCSTKLVIIKLPIFNHVFRSTLGAPHKRLQFTNSMYRSIPFRPIIKAANSVVYITQSSGGGILREVVLYVYSSSTYYEDVRIAHH